MLNDWRSDSHNSWLLILFQGSNMVLVAEIKATCFVHWTTMKLQICGQLLHGLRIGWWNCLWLVVWNIFFHILGSSSSQLTNSIIFQRGRSTTKQAHPGFISDSRGYPMKKNPSETCVNWPWPRNHKTRGALWHHQIEDEITSFAC